MLTPKNKMRFATLAMVGVLLMVPAVVFATTAPNASTVLTNTTQQLNTLAGSIVNIISIIMGLVGAIMLGVNLAKYFKGDPSSNDALTKVGAGLLIATVILQIIRVTYLSSGTAATS